jgi:hypothetical protein
VRSASVPPRTPGTSHAIAPDRDDIIGVVAIVGNTGTDVWNGGADGRATPMSVVVKGDGRTKGWSVPEWGQVAGAWRPSPLT